MIAAALEFYEMSWITRLCGAVRSTELKRTVVRSLSTLKMSNWYSDRILWLAKSWKAEAEDRIMLPENKKKGNANVKLDRFYGK